MRGLVLMALMVTAYVVRELWVLAREKREIIYPFPYAQSQHIAEQTFWFMYGGYAFMALIGFILWWGMRSQKVFWFCVFGLQFAELIEYRLNYNYPWGVADFGAFRVNLNITNLRYLVLGFAAAYEIIKYSWKKSIKE
jgi:hypothetical protein